MVNMGIFNITGTRQKLHGSAGKLYRYGKYWTSPKRHYLFRDRSGVPVEGVDGAFTPPPQGPYNYGRALLFVFSVLTIILNKTSVWPNSPCLLILLDNCRCCDVILRNLLFLEWMQNTFRRKRYATCPTTTASLVQ